MSISAKRDIRHMELAILDMLGEYRTSSTISVRLQIEGRVQHRPYKLSAKGIIQDVFVNPASVPPLEAGS